MGHKPIRYEVADGVALITLDRPERLNAWTGGMELEYRRAIASAEVDSEVRAIVVTGEGRGFCAGADTAALDKLAGTGDYDSGMREAPPEPGFGVRADFDHPHAFHLGLSKPVLAAINGPAAGVGFVLACFCDLRFAAAGAKLTTSFGRLGLPAEYGLSWLLPRLVGVARAAELLFTSRVVLAEEAYQMGLLNGVLPPDELVPHVLDVARRMAAEISPASLRVMKRQLYGDLLDDLDGSVRRSIEHMHRMVGEPDFAEGVAALAARRPPTFAPPASP
jgi:enoyl-CoA hydratase/carnithine racemase